MDELIERTRMAAKILRDIGGQSAMAATVEEAAAALEAAREDACVALVADIRLACGDNGKRMQPELVEFIRGLAADAERYRWLRDPCSGAERVIFYCRGDYGKGLMSSAMLDAAIDAARAGREAEEG